MLSELSGLQESDEETWGTARLSFTIRTRYSEEDEIVERTYTFSRAPEWDKWTFMSFKERRAEDEDTLRNWRVTEDAHWSEPNEIPDGISVPQTVQDELEELLGLEEITIESP